MAKSTMVNFRLKEDDVKRIDQAAERLGLSRSDFIRKAISEEVQEILGGTAVATVGKRGKAQDAASLMRDSNCPRNTYCVFVKDSTGGRICGTCNFRK